jgi:hypothetical protein
VAIRPPVTFCSGLELPKSLTQMSPPTPFALTVDFQ